MVGVKLSIFFTLATFSLHTQATKVCGLSKVPTTCYKKKTVKQAYDCSFDKENHVCDNIINEVPTECGTYDCSTYVDRDICKDELVMTDKMCTKDVTKRIGYSCMKDISKTVCKYEDHEYPDTCNQPTKIEEQYPCKKKQPTKVCGMKTTIGSCDKTVQTKALQSCMEPKEVCKTHTIKEDTQCTKTSHHKEAYDCSNEMIKVTCKKTMSFTVPALFGSKGLYKERTLTKKGNTIIDTVPSYTDGDLTTGSTTVYTNNDAYTDNHVYADNSVYTDSDPQIFTHMFTPTEYKQKWDKSYDRGCHKDKVIIPKTCHKDIPYQETYPCKKDKAVQTCKTVDVASQCWGTVGKSVSYPCPIEKEQCLTKLVDYDDTCTRVKMVSKSYPCTKTKKEKVCGEKSVAVASTCYREDIVQKSYSCPEKTLINKCKKISEKVEKMCVKEEPCMKKVQSKECHTENILIPKTCYNYVLVNQPYKCYDKIAECEFSYVRKVKPFDNDIEGTIIVDSKKQLQRDMLNDKMAVMFPNKYQKTLISSPQTLPAFTFPSKIGS